VNTAKAANVHEPTGPLLVPTALLQHVRTVHFSTLATAFVLTVAAFLKPAADIDRALTQLDHVSRIRAAAGGALLASVFNAETSCAVPSGITAINVDNELAHWQYHLRSDIYRLHPSTWGQYPSAYWTANPVATLPDRLVRFPGDGPIALQGERLGDFQRGWRELLDQTSAIAVTKLSPQQVTYRWLSHGSGTVPYPIADAHGGLGPQSKNEPLTQSAQVPVSIGIRMSNPDQLMSQLYALNATAELEMAMDVVSVMPSEEGEYHNPLIAVFPVDFVRISCKPLAQLLNFAKFAPDEVAQMDGNFDSAFGDLSKLSKGLGSLTMSDINGYLHRLRDESGKEIELYGAKIPQEAISIWGTILLVTLQLYFVAHLGHIVSYRSLNATLPAFAWIGIYPDQLSRAMTLSSLTFAPLTVALLILTTWQSMSGASVKLLECAILGASLGLAGITLVQTRCIRSFALDPHSGSNSEDDATD
jgi:hypothetical protein